jgi:adenylate cyclase
LNFKIAVFSNDQSIQDYLVELFIGYPKENISFLNSYNEVVEKLPSIKPECLIAYVSEIKDLHENELYTWIRNNPHLDELPIIFLQISSLEKKQDYDHSNNLDKNLHSFQIPCFKENLFIQIEKSIRKNNSILFVDDSPIIHKVLRETLEKNNFIIYEAYNGKEGLEILKRIRPDIIVTDIEMPEMNGYEFCKTVKNNPFYTNIPVLILSSLSSGIEIDRGFDAGANDYLTKPIDIEEFISRLKNLLQTSILPTREKILLIDDSTIILSMMTAGLEQQGFRVYTAPNGKEGLEKVLEIKPEMIITDKDMPIMDGWTFFNELKKLPEHSKIPTIMITSRESKAEKAKSAESGLKAYLTKPFTTDKLVAIIEKTLAEKRSEKEKEILKFYISDAAFENAQNQSMQKNGFQMRAKEMYATVFFSDIAKFTPLCEKLSPIEVINLLNDYFDLMCQFIKKYNGIIDKFIGDAIMAVFNNKEIGAYNAVQAGFEMMNSLKEFNQNRENPIHMRIGLNYGRLFIGDIGSKLYRRDFTVIGDTVNMAQRLESNCKIDGMLISESMYELVKPQIEAERVGPISLKGKAGEFYAYDVQNVKLINP